MSQGEREKAVYESLSAIHAELDMDPAEQLVELARTLAKGGPYASTVERFARDHGYGRTQDPGEDPGPRWSQSNFRPGNYGPGQPRVPPPPGEWDPTGLLRSREDPDWDPRDHPPGY